MVTRSHVDLQKYIRSSYLIEQVIDPREWVSVLDSHFVELMVIGAHQHCTILFLAKQYRYAPRGHTGLDIPFLPATAVRVPQFFVH